MFSWGILPGMRPSHLHRLGSHRGDRLTIAVRLATTTSNHLSATTSSAFIDGGNRCVQTIFIGSWEIRWPCIMQMASPNHVTKAWPGLGFAEQLIGKEGIARSITIEILFISTLTRTAACSRDISGNWDGWVI